MITPEVLSPAGDMQRLAAAVQYGADAVYLGAKMFGMRAAPQNFAPDELKQAVGLCHEKGVKVYLTCNTVPTNQEADELPEFLKIAGDCGVDAIIAADVGVMMTVKKVLPDIPLHISTQAGIMNYLTATELYHMGAARVVLARELSLDEIKYLREHTPSQLEIETFVHGAMCMSVSGRCLLSNYMVQRDANRGECAQPCRWGYFLMEEKRPGQYFPVFEDEKGSYILNAKDLCMIEHIDKLVNAGVTSLKIEGRAKSEYYVAAITNAYRNAVDEYLHSPKEFHLSEWIVQETRKVSHREYSTGFYFGKPGQYYQNAGYVRSWDIIAVVDDYKDGFLEVIERNRFFKGDMAEVMLPKGKPVPIKIQRIIDPEEGEVETACHPMKRYLIPYDHPLPKGAMIRMERESL